MYDVKEKEEDTRTSERTADSSPACAPPLLLAGIDEDDTAEANVVRGID